MKNKHKLSVYANELNNLPVNGEIEVCGVQIKKVSDKDNASGCSKCCNNTEYCGGMLCGQQEVIYIEVKS